MKVNKINQFFKLAVVISITVLNVQCSSNSSIEETPATSAITACPDIDGDGYGSTTSTTTSTLIKSVTTSTTTDLDADDEDTSECTSVDSEDEIPDGYANIALGEDCNDTDETINPGATDIEDDGIDQNCDDEDATSSSDDGSDDGSDDNADDGSDDDSDDGSDDDSDDGSDDDSDDGSDDGDDSSSDDEKFTLIKIEADSDVDGTIDTTTYVIASGTDFDSLDIVNAITDASNTDIRYVGVDQSNDGTINYSLTNTINSNNQRTALEYSSETYTYKQVYSYDDDGNMKAQYLDTDNDGYYNGKYTFTYNDDGKLTVKDTYSSSEDDGSFTKIASMSYEREGDNLVGSKSDSDGDGAYDICYLYTDHDDHNNYLATKKDTDCDDTADSTVFTYEYTYDDNDHVIYKKTTYSSGSYTSIERTYNDNGDLSTYLYTYTSGSTLKYVYTYNDDNKVSKAEYFKDGSETASASTTISYTEYDSYDDAYGAISAE